MNVATIKKELRQLRKTIHIVEALKETQERYIKRIEALSRLVQTDKIKEQIETTKKVMSLMNIAQYVEEATELEKKYMTAINRLEPMEKAIILESFINSKPYWKIGLQFGYSEEGVRKKIDAIIRKLLSYFEKIQPAK